LVVTNNSNSICKLKIKNIFTFTNTFFLESLYPMKNFGVYFTQLKQPNMQHTYLFFSELAKFVHVFRPNQPTHLAWCAIKKLFSKRIFCQVPNVREVRKSKITNTSIHTLLINVEIAPHTY